MFRNENGAREANAKSRRTNATKFFFFSNQKFDSQMIVESCNFNEKKI